MQKYLITIIILLIALKSTAQILIIPDCVVNEKGEGLFAVNVYLKDNTAIGTVTGLDGNFQLKISSAAESSNAQIVVSFIGYKTEELHFSRMDSVGFLKIILKEAQLTLDEVKIEANQSISREFSIKEFDKLQIYLSPLASADPLKAIALLPASTNTSETANPELRGSSAYRSKVFFNGVPLSNPVRNSQINGIGFFSLINPEMIKTMQVYASNPPLTFGNSSAGLIDIETNTALLNNQTQLTISLASLGINLARKTGNKSFIQVYGNRLFSDSYLAVNQPLKHKLHQLGSLDGGFNFHTELTDNWSLNFFNYTVSEKSIVKLNLFTWPDLATAATLRDFSIINVKYNCDKVLIALNIGTNFSKSHFEFGNIDTDNRQHSHYFSFNAKYLPNTKLKIQAGVCNDFTASRFTNKLPVYYFALSPDSPYYSNYYSLQNNTTETYFYTCYSPIKSLILGFSERNVWSVKRGLNVPESAFQLNLRYNLSKNHSVLLAGGNYYNIAEPIYEQWNFKTLKSEQLSVEYQFASNSVSVNLVGYMKKELGEDVGNQYIKGTEVFCEFTMNHNLKASFSNTVLYDDSAVFNETQNETNQTGYFCTGTLSYSNVDIFNIAMSVNWRKGKAIRMINNASYHAPTGFYEPDYTTQSNVQLPNYTTVNISISKLIDLFHGTAIVFGSVNNMLNIHNKNSIVYSADYSAYTYDNYQLRSVYFGLMYSF